MSSSERYSASPPDLADVDDRRCGRRAGAVDLTQVVPSDALRRAGFQAAGAVVIVLVAILFASRSPARQAIDAAALTLFPSASASR